MIRKGLLIVFLLLSGGSLSAQNQSTREPLRQVLDSLSNQYNINFNYADETIDGIFIVSPSKNLSIDELLMELQQKTKLNFEPLSDTLISISNDQPTTINICGYIFDIENHQPISGAAVQNKTNLSITDEKGFFELKNVSANDTILLSSLGYEISHNIASTYMASPCIEIFMKPRITKLKEIIISNFIIHGIDINSDGAIRIDTKTLGILPGLTDPDVLQTLQALPGIQSINETVSDINVRGGTNDQNLIYWDGIRMYQSGHFFGLISAFNPFITNNVTLIKNGTTTALSEGVSSTILIETDDRVDQQFRGSAGINMINADMFLKIPLAKKVSLQISGRRSIADLIQTPTYQQYFNRAFRNTDVTSSTDPGIDSLVDSNDQFNFYDVTGKLLYDVTQKDKLRISFLRIYNKINYEENAFAQQELQTKTSGLEQSTLAAGATYRRIWDEKFTTNAQLYYSGYTLDALNFDIKNEQRLIQENEILDTGLKLDGRLALNDQLDLFSGYQFSEVGISNLADINNPPFRRLIKRVIRSHAAFSEVNYGSRSATTNLRLGLRASFFEKFNKWMLEPRLAFNQKFLNHFSFELLGEIKSQTSTQIIDLQNDFLGVEKRRWILANEEDIPVTSSKQVSMGLRFQKGSFLASIDGYWKMVDNITSSSQGFQNQFQYDKSIGSYETKGLDVLINQGFGKLTSWLSYSMADTKYEFSDFDPSVFPSNLDIRHIVTFGSSYLSNNFQLSGGLNWHTGKPFTPAVGVINNEILFDTPNSFRLDDYLRIDVSAKYHLKFSDKTTGEIGASVWNLLNNKNIINIYYQVNDSGELKTVRQSALEFTPNLFLRMNF